MGLLGKLFWIAIIIVVAIVVYENWETGSVQFCVNDNPTEMDVTCITKTDCVDYLTSVYGSYPDTELYRNVLDETSSCRSGKCVVDEFYDANTCPSTTSTLIYKTTIKDKVKLWFN